MREKRALTFVVGACVAVVLLSTAPVEADTARVNFLVERLKGGDDFRVRTNAALALGAVGEADKDAAVTPLCQSLSDSSDVVRQAVAVALKRVGRTSALGCLRSRMNVEQSAQVKLQLSRAIEAISDSDSSSGSSSGGSSSSADVTNFTPRSIPGARYYVAIASVTNNTNRSSADIDRDILPTVRSKIESLGTHQIAPTKESPDAARATMSRRKMKGYYLSCSVDPFDYSNRNLRVRVKCAVFDYPGKNLRGEVPAGLTQTGVSPGDHAAEDNLLQMAASRAVELFVQNFQ